MTMEQWLVYASLVLAVTAVPGPSTLLVVHYGLYGGPRSAARAAMGNALGVLMICLASGAGLRAISDYPPEFCRGLRFAGGCFLVIMGIAVGSGVARRHTAVSDVVVCRSVPARGFNHGLLVGATNPLVFSFCVGTFPLFFGAGQALSVIGIVALAGVFCALSFCCLMLYGGCADMFRRLLRERLLDIAAVIKCGICTTLGVCLAGVALKG